MSASYPGAVKTFATRNTGDTIQASHVQDLQDEVNAIESGLLNGTAPLTSSNAHVQHLQVDLTSTFAAAINFTAASTFTNISAGNSTFADLTVTAPPASVSVTNSAALNVNSGAATALTFDTEFWQTVAGMHSTSANTSRLIPPSSGLYGINGVADWQGGSTGSNICVLSIRVDGSSQIALVQDKDPGGLTQHVSAWYYFRSTSQYVELVANQNSGSTKSIAVVADYSPSFALTKLR